MLALFRMEGAEYISLLPKSITTAIGKGLSEELGGFPAITMATIMLTGLFGAVAAPSLLGGGQEKFQHIPSIIIKHLIIGSRNQQQPSPHRLVF